MTAPPGQPGAGYLLFSLAGLTLALLQAAVREVLPLPHLSRPPGLPAPVAGLLDLGGMLVPVLDLEHLLGLPAGPPRPAGGLYRHIILLHPAPEATGLLVDRVLDLAPAAAGLWRPLPPEQSLNGCVAGGLALGGALVPVLDTGRLLLAQEREALAGLARRAQARLAAWQAP